MQGCKFRILECEGYKMFYGTQLVANSNGAECITGDWLYKPDTDCWYCKGRSFPATTTTLVAVLIEEI